MKGKKIQILTDGIVKNNPVFRLVLGTCPTLAVTTSLINGLGMGMATTFVLLCSNVLVSLLRNIIPDKVRIPAFILIIATFVTLVEMTMRRYIPSLYDSLGLFLSLIVVNCVILARAESFASVSTVAESALDGLGMGIGFTLSLAIIGFVREFLGAGSILGHEIKALQSVAMSIFILPAGGFLTYGLLMAAVNHISEKLEIRRKKAREHKMLEQETQAKGEAL